MIHVTTHEGQVDDQEISLVGLGHSLLGFCYESLTQLIRVGMGS